MVLLGSRRQAWDTNRLGVRVKDRASTDSVTLAGLLGELSPRASLLEYLHSLVGPRVIIPKSFQLPGELALRILLAAPDAQQSNHVLLFRAVSVETESLQTIHWPEEAVEPEAIDFDGDRLSIVTSNETIRFRLDRHAPITLLALDASVDLSAPTFSLAALQASRVPIQSQSLTAEIPPKHKWFVAPPSGPIFTPPREYYLPRDLKSLLGLVAGVALIAFGFYIVYATRGIALYGWAPVIIGCYIIVATFLDLALFPPWRF